MADTLLYYGQFGSEEHHQYRVEILATDGREATASEVFFSADSPAVIEWGDTEKTDTVCSSSLTLTLVSDEDRRFASLYTVNVGAVRADIYRDGSLYWSGTLDTELFEEPYAYERDYETQFTFSDFAVLERKKWSLTGRVSVEAALTACLSATGINYGVVNKTVSTMRNGQTVDFSNMYLQCANFYDEDGEPMTVRDVLEAILQPFALRITQRAGELHLYDINGAVGSMETEEIYWKSDDATLSADKTYNDIKITFSPYADTALVDGTLEEDDVLQDATAVLYKVDNNWSDTADGFKLYSGAQKSDDGLPITIMDSTAKLFRIEAAWSGSDEAGVIYGRKGNTSTNYDTSYGGFPKVRSGDTYSSSAVFSVNAGFLGYVSYRRSDYKLKVELQTLFDVRYNPFESAERPNEKGNYERLQNWANFGYVPVMINLKDEKGNITYHYENSKVMLSESYQQTGARWVSGEGDWGCCYLCYYDESDRKSASGFGGWATNRQIIGYYRDTLPKIFTARGTGEFIDLPPVGGYLELIVGKGIHQFDYNREEKDIWSRVRWLAYKNPKITLVNKNGTDIEYEDIEDTAWINQAAKEELEIDTTIGTLGEKICQPSARGLIFDSSNAAISTFERSTRSDRLEQLLIGTAYSQYAERKSVLNGTARIISGMRLLTDRNTNGKFLITEESQNLREDSSEITANEVIADDYSNE